MSDTNNGLDTIMGALLESNESIEALALILSELAQARAKHPQWPVDVIHAAAILAEEAGEVVKAALDMTYDGVSVEEVRTELAQTGAMCIRMLVNLHNNEVKPNQEQEREYDPYDAIRENMEPRA